MSTHLSAVDQQPAGAFHNVAPSANIQQQCQSCQEGLRPPAGHGPGQDSGQAGAQAEEVLEQQALEGAPGGPYHVAGEGAGSSRHQRHRRALGHAEEQQQPEGGRGARHDACHACQHAAAVQQAPAAAALAGELPSARPSGGANEESGHAEIEQPATAADEVKVADEGGAPASSR